MYASPTFTSALFSFAGADFMLRWLYFSQLHKLVLEQPNTFMRVWYSMEIENELASPAGLVQIAQLCISRTWYWIEFACSPSWKTHSCWDGTMKLHVLYPLYLATFCEIRSGPSWRAECVVSTLQSIQMARSFFPYLILGLLWPGLVWLLEVNWNRKDWISCVLARLLYH